MNEYVAVRAVRGLRSWGLRLFVLCSAVTAVALLTAACGGNDQAKEAAAGDRTAVKIADAQRRPSFVLTDTTGRRFDFRAETAGYLTLLYFGYTNCPDVCPIHFGNIAGGLDQIPESLRGRVKVIFVGVDPPRDSPERIRQWLDHFDTTFIGLTGTDEELMRAQVAAGIPPAVREAADENGRYAVSHAGWVLGYTAGDEQTWQFPLGVRQQSWAETLETLVKIGRTDS